MADLRLVVGQAMRAERTRRGMSQQALGRQLGWSRATIGSLENGERALYVHELPALCRALGVPFERLILDADDRDREALGLRAGMLRPAGVVRQFRGRRPGPPA